MKNEVDDVGILREEGEISGAMWLFPEEDHRVSGHVFNGTSFVLSSPLKSIVVHFLY